MGPAGLLLGGGEGRPSAKRASASKSALLLAGRILLACLLLFAGAMQVRYRGMHACRVHQCARLMRGTHRACLV